VLIIGNRELVRGAAWDYREMMQVILALDAEGSHPFKG
jgi:hypothetical protein